MSKKINRAGIMALENLENAVDAAEVKGEPVEGVQLEGGKQGEGVEGGGETVVASTVTPEATGTVVETEPASAVADGDAIAIIEAAVKEVEIDDGVLALEDLVNDVEATSDQIEEATDIVETVDGMNDALAQTCEAPAEVVPPVEGDPAPAAAAAPAGDVPAEEAPVLATDDNFEAVDEFAEVPTENPIPEGAEGISPAQAQALRVAVEHFRKRLGDTNAKRVFPAMENFGSKKTKAEGARMALAHNRKFALEARRAVHVAQEGLLDQIGNAWKQFFATEAKLLARLDQVSTAYDKGTPLTDAIKNPAWGKVLNIGRRSTVSSGDVQSMLTTMEKAFNGDTIAAGLIKAADLVNDLTSGIRKSVFKANDKDMEFIDDAYNGLMGSVKTVQDALPADAKGKDADFQPADAGAKGKLVTSLSSLLESKKLSAAIEKLDTAIAGYHKEYATRMGTRNLGVFAADLRASRKGVKKAAELQKLALNLAKTNVRVCHSAISYLAASVRAPKAAA